MIPKCTVRWYLCAALCGFLAAPAYAETTVRRFDLPDRGKLALSVPDGWIDNVSQPPERLPPTILFKPRSGQAFAVLVTPVWAVDPSKRLTPAKVEKIVRDLAARLAPQSVEGKLQITPITGTSGSGFHVSATDKAPKPGEFKFITQGALTVGELVATFTILTNDGQADVIQKGLAMMATARHVER